MTHDGQKLLIAVDLNGGAQPLAGSGDLIERLLSSNDHGPDFEALGFQENSNPQAVGLYVFEGAGRERLSELSLPRWEGDWRIATTDDLDFFGVATAESRVA